MDEWYQFCTINSIVILICSILSGSCAILFPSIKSFYLESFCSGAFIGISFIHLLPVVYFGGFWYNYSIFSILIFLLYLIDFLSHHNDFSKTKKSINLSSIESSNQSSIIYDDSALNESRGTQFISLFFLSISSAILGTSIGDRLNKAPKMTIFFSVVFQKIFEVLFIGVQIQKSHSSQRIYWTTIIIYSFITPISIILAMIYPSTTSFAIFSSFCAIGAAVFTFIGFSRWYRIFFSPYDYNKRETLLTSLLFFGGIFVISLTGIGYKTLK